MVSKLLLNEIRHIKMSGSLSLFIALEWFYVACVYIYIYNVYEYVCVYTYI